MQGITAKSAPAQFIPPTISREMLCHTSIDDFKHKLDKMDYSVNYCSTPEDTASFIALTLLSGFLNLIPLGLSYIYDRCITVPHIKKRALENYIEARKQALVELNWLREHNGNLDSVKEIIIPFKVGRETHSLQLTQTWENARVKLTGQIYNGVIKNVPVSECNKLRSGFPITLSNISLENIYCELLKSNTTTNLDSDEIDVDEITTNEKRNNGLMNLNFSFTSTTADAFKRLKLAYNDYFFEKYHSNMNVYEQKIEEKFKDELSSIQLLSGTLNAEDAAEMAFGFNSADFKPKNQTQVSILQKTTIDYESEGSPEIWVLSLTSSPHTDNLLNQHLQDIETAAYRCQSKRVILNPDLQQLKAGTPDATHRFAELVIRLRNSGINVFFYDKQVTKILDNLIIETNFSSKSFWDDISGHLPNNELEPISKYGKGLGEGWSRKGDLIINIRQFGQPVGKDSDPESFNNQLGEKSTIHATFIAACNTSDAQKSNPETVMPIKIESDSSDSSDSDA